MGTTPELPLEAETLQKPAEKTTMEEKTNKFTNYKCETNLEACTMQEVRICKKTGQRGRIRKKHSRGRRECARWNGETHGGVRSREEEHGYL
jgi:hypothetical protein